MKRLSLYVLLTVSLTLTSYLLFSGFSYQTPAKIGYIDSQRIFAEYSEFIDAGKKIEEERKKYETEVNRMRDDLLKRQQDMEKQQLLLSEEKKQQLTQELNDLYTKMQEYGQKHLGADGTVAQLSQLLTDPILEKVRGVIDTIGKEQGYDYIFDRSSELILFAKEDYDLTDKVLETLGKK